MCTQVLKEKMDVMRLTFYTAPVSVGILVPFFLLTEFKKLLAYGCAFTTAVVMHAASSPTPPCTCPCTDSRPHLHLAVSSGNGITATVLHAGS